MDTSYWNNLNKNIEFYDTSKQYYKKYLWRMGIRADGGRLLTRNKKWTFDQALAHRVAIEAQYSSRYWYPKHIRASTTDYDLELLTCIESIKHSHKNIMIRVEEPNVQFYAEDEATLKNIAAELNKNECIVDITGPANHSDEVLLKSGAILTRRNNEYNYKIMLRDGRYTTEVKQQILRYLDSLDDEVRLTPGSREMLNKSYPSMWGVYFYAKDAGIATFLKLFDPNLVSNIHELVNTDNK